MIAVTPRLDALARVGRALVDPTRCRLLFALLDGPAYSGALAVELGISKANASNHLSCLRGCGLIEAIPEGRHVRYELTDPALAHALRDLADIMLAVESDEICHVDMGVQ